MKGDSLSATAKQCIANHSMLDVGDGVVVGVSGGPDSVALLLFLLEIAPEYDLRLHIAHVNHMIRGADADADADYVRRLGESLGVPVTAEQIDVPEMARTSGATVEDAGRSARYGLFRQTAKTLGFNKVAVGHSADDQAETVLMRVIRGTGIRGLAGIPPTRDLGEGITLIRPLIETTRDAIEAYCKEKNVRPRQDATNVDLAYFRNRIRCELLPLLEANYNSNVRASLIRLAAIAAEDEAYLQTAAHRLLEHAMAPPETRFGTEVGLGTESGIHFECASAQHRGDLCLNLDVLRNAPPALLARALTAAFADVAEGDHDLYYSHLDALSSLVSDGAVGDSIDLPRGVRARLTYYSLLMGQARGAGMLPARQGVSRECEGPQESQHGIGCNDRFELKVPGSTSVPFCGVTIHAAVGEADEVGASLMDVADLAEFGRQVLAWSGLDGMSLDPSCLGASWVIFDADKVDMDGLAVRPWEAGDRLAPFGMEGTKKVSDMFIDKKIPRRERARWPIVVHGDEVVWVVGLRASSVAPVDSGTTRYGLLVAEWDCDWVAQGRY